MKLRLGHAYAAAFILLISAPPPALTADKPLPSNEETECCPAEARDISELQGRASFFKVPLVCPAAPQIGCGGRSKPILLELERQKGVEEAWLNRAGTILAVVWEKDLSKAKRAQILKSVAKAEELETEELKGDAAKSALENFAKGAGWHRGEEVDRLTEEEIGVIAERLTRRVAAKVSLAPEAEKGLQADLALLGKRLFLLGRGDSAATETKNDPLAEIARRRLPENAQGVLRDAVEQGYVPLPGEK